MKRSVAIWVTSGFILGAGSFVAGSAMACDHDGDHDHPQASAQPQQDAGPPPGVSAEEMRLLQQGVAADKKARDDRPKQNIPKQGLFVGSQPPGGLMNPNISLILDTAAAYFSAAKPQQTGAHDPSETGFNLQQLELHIESAVDPFCELQTNIVFSQFGVEVEEAYARSLALPGRLQVRAGQFLAPFGRLNPTHPHSWHFADQPIVNGKFLGSEGLRGLGLETSVLLPLPWYVEVTATAQMGKDICCGRSFWGGDALPVRTPMDLLGIARVAQFFPITRSWSVMWGVSGAFGPNGSGHGNRADILASDLYVRWRPPQGRQRQSLSWHSEWMKRSRQLPGRLLEDDGWMTQLVYRYALRWEVGARAERVTGIEDDPLDPEWNGTRQRYTAQWTFFPSHFSRIRMQASVDHMAWKDEPIVAVFLAGEVLIGAHGAHKF